jgi:hypothetical protein
MSDRWTPKDEMGGPVEHAQSLADGLKLHPEDSPPLSTVSSYSIGPSRHPPMPPPLPRTASGQVTQTLSDAPNVRARLITEAHAAAVALDKLKRMLELGSLDELNQLAHYMAEDRASAPPMLAPLPSMFALVPVAEDRGMFFPATLPYPESTMHHARIRGFIIGLALSSLVGAALYMLL